MDLAVWIYENPWSMSVWGVAFTTIALMFMPRGSPIAIGTAVAGMIIAMVGVGIVWGDKIPL